MELLAIKPDEPIGCLSVAMELSERTDVTRVFLLGRWTSLLEQCLRLVGEKAAATRGFVAEKFFRVKNEETLFNTQKLCEDLASGSDLGASTAGANALDHAENRFCELAVDFFRLRLYLLSKVPIESEEELHPYDDEFAKSQFERMFRQRTDGRGLSLELRPLGLPSLNWLRDEVYPGSCFHLLYLCMESLLDSSATSQLNFAELANLGTHSAEVEGFERESEAGTLDEPKAAKFWIGMAASLLSDSLAVDRLLLVERRRRVRALSYSNSSLSSSADTDTESEACPPPAIPVFARAENV